METLLSKIRAKIAVFKGDIDGARKLIVSLQEQILFLQAQLKEAEAAQLGAQDFLNKIKAIKNDITTLQQTQVWL